MTNCFEAILSSNVHAALLFCRVLLIRQCTHLQKAT